MLFHKYHISIPLLFVGRVSKRLRDLGIVFSCHRTGMRMDYFLEVSGIDEWDFIHSLDDVHGVRFLGHLVDDRPEVGRSGPK